MFEDDRDGDGYEDYDDVRNNDANSDDENEEFDVNDNEDIQQHEEEEYKAEFRDRERVGMDGPIGQELGANIENVKKKVRSKRDRALEEILAIQHRYEFTNEKNNRIQEIIVFLKGLEYFDLEILYSAAVYAYTNKTLNQKDFDAHLKKFPLDIQRKKDDENRKELDHIVLLRYIRKVQENEKKRRK